MASARTLWLPSGRRVRAQVMPGASRSPKRQKALFDDVRGLLRSGRLSVEDAKSRAKLEPSAIESMPLADFHVLRDFAIRSGAIAVEPEKFPCDNCDRELVFDGAALPLADLDDRYRDEPVAKERAFPLPEPLALRGGTVDRVRMRPVTVAEAAPLHRALAGDRGFRITPELISAMGVVRLEGSVTIDDPRAMSRALTNASDACWSAVESAFLELAYPERAITTLVCPACETVHDLEVPWPRELEPGQYHAPRDPDAPFPSAEEFEDHVARVALEVFERMGVAGMTLRVEPGVAELDSGGVPMLGSYGPEPGEDGRTDFVVTLYYRSFERSFRDDPSFDWQHEVDETLEHEVQHHLYYLEGHDPMDESERKESEADAIRRAGGKARYAREQRAALAAETAAIVRVLGPLLALVAIAAFLFLQCS